MAIKNIRKNWPNTTPVKTYYVKNFQVKGMSTKKYPMHNNAKGKKRGGSYIIDKERERKKAPPQCS